MTKAQKILIIFLSLLILTTLINSCKEEEDGVEEVVVVEGNATLIIYNMYSGDINDIVYNGQRFEVTLTPNVGISFSIAPEYTGLHRIFFFDVAGSQYMSTTDTVYTAPDRSTEYNITVNFSTLR
jgi:hypothetical protein